MSKQLAVIPERCSGCKICEVVCSIKHFHVTNPKKSAIRVMVVYPHPVVRMPIVCSQCRIPKCSEGCPVNAIVRRNGVVEIDRDECISCLKCLKSCPFGALYVHDDVEQPIKCDLCGGDPACVKACPKDAILFIPEHVLGQAQRLNNVLSYYHMKEIEYFDRGEKKQIRYAEIGKEEI
ncbi:MAG TPA: 4Fe-4S dicluster domain-containing protein [Thermodesulfobacteriota bacterium]|nr:4Fe-4S dicluster domain-containing protein [Deltaproteobacteria bacterium]HNU71919.1 4Fe-4S dicluster domain-containing protein [Thermodesulfobacteriota bacterium]HOC38078.1 4Fe-4S dicluster domain-containing protein [Thermodesulfobacteriota bacterium]